MASDFKFTDAAVDKFLNVLRGVNITAPATLYIGLAVSQPLDTETSAQIVAREVTGDAGYARQVIAFNAPATVSNIRKIANSANVLFGAFVTGGMTITHYFLIDCLTGSTGTVWGFGALGSSQVISAGNTISLNAGQGSVGIN